MSLEINYYERELRNNMAWLYLYKKWGILTRQLEMQTKDNIKLIEKLLTLLKEKQNETD